LHKFIVVLRKKSYICSEKVAASHLSTKKSQTKKPGSRLSWMLLPKSLVAC